MTGKYPKAIAGDMIKYPYDIPPAPKLDSKTLKNLDLWNALEFFRVEALLRSPSVWTLYQRTIRRKGKVVCPVEREERWQVLSSQVYKQNMPASTARRLLADETLRSHLFIDDGWLVLWGAHHRYVTDPSLNPPQPSPFDISEGVLDLSALEQECKLDWGTLRTNLQTKQNLNLYLKINCSVAPEANLQVLRSLLQNKHKVLTIKIGKPNIDPSTGIHTFPFHPRKNPPIKDYLAWWNYFQCYDLQHCKGLTYEAIGSRVYGNDEVGDTALHAQKAVYRVTRLIAAAEVNTWPPNNLSS